MSAPRVWLGGEGPTEIGGRDREGVLHVVVRALRPDASVVGAIAWKDIPRFKAGAFRKREERNVLGLVQHAREKKATVVVFARDRDGNTERAARVEKAIATAKAEWSDIAIGGGCAVEQTEAWSLLALEDPRAEHHANPGEVLAQRGHETNVAAQCAVLAEVGALARIPPTSHFGRWLFAVRAALAAP